MKIFIICHHTFAIYHNSRKIIVTLWLFNIAMENGPFIDGLPIKNGKFPMAMLNNQRVV